MGRHSAAEAIEIQNLSKWFGKVQAVNNLSLSVQSGEVVGFLGPNGAGKTTTMRILLGLISPSSGSVSVLGFDAKKGNKDMLAEMGYLPGSLNLYESMTALEFLGFCAKLRKRNCNQQINDLAQRFKLDLHRHIHDLSKGNRQKVGVIAAFMHEPKVLILDEPTSGLDPLMQLEFEKMLAEAKSKGAAVLLSSHVMSEVENLSDKVAIINQGQLVLFGTMDELREKALHRLEFTFTQPVSAEEFLSIAGVKSANSVGTRVICDVYGAETEILRKAVDLDAIAVKSEEMSLEKIFIEHIQDGGLK